MSMMSDEEEGRGEDLGEAGESSLVKKNPIGVSELVLLNSLTC